MWSARARAWSLSAKASRTSSKNEMIDAYPVSDFRPGGKLYYIFSKLSGFFILKRLVYPFLLICASGSYASAQSYSDFFDDATLRVDYTLAGSDTSQHVFFNELLSLPHWCGRRVNLSSAPVHGNGQVLVLIDGHPQYQGVFGHSISDSYQTMMVERVEVLRGPASVLYGSNAMGGVINIITRGMKEDGVRTDINVGVGSWGTVQTEISNQLRMGKFSSTVAAQYSRSDNHRPRMGFEQYGGYVKLGYDISQNWNAFADIDLTHFNSSYPGTTDAPMYEADQWITRGVATLGIENHYAKTNGRLSVYDNFGIHKINDGYKSGAKPQTELFRSKDALAGVSWYQTLSTLPGNSITLGVDYQHI